MQNNHIKLNEIIWEITGQCKNGCKYCGSKEAWNEPINTDNIIKIANNIAKSRNKPKAVDVSGGDPLLVDITTHRYITDVFKTSHIEAKILCNLKSLTMMDDAIEKLKLYNWVGISVNTKVDLDLLERFKWQLLGIDYTIITNFNLENIFIFDKIKEQVKNFEKMWQIQYTVYSREDEPLALYNVDAANEVFFKNIKNARKEGIKIVLADNMNNGTCGAGICSLGILSNGMVVPCLSMRSWVTCVTRLSQGNILEDCLDNIWEQAFHDYRFADFKCCKDFCKNKCYKEPVDDTPSINLEDFKEPKVWTAPIDRDNRTILYGISDSKFYVYAVPSDRVHATYYAVSTKDVDDLDETIENYKPIQNDSTEDRPIMRVVSIYSVTTSNTGERITWEDLQKKQGKR